MLLLIQFVNVLKLFILSPKLSKANQPLLIKALFNYCTMYEYVNIQQHKQKQNSIDISFLSYFTGL